MAVSLAGNDVALLLTFLRDLYAIRDLRSFRSHVISRISVLVHSDVTSYNEVNWDKQQHSSVSHPSGALDLRDRHRIFDEHIREHPLIRHYARTGDRQAFKISDFLGPSEFHRSGVYANFYRPLGIEHQMAFVFPAPKSQVIGVALNRSSPDFTERDRLLLNLLRPHLIQAYRNAEAATLMLQQIGPVPSTPEESGRAAILLDRRKQILLMSERTPELLAKYFSDGFPERDCLPEILDTWIRHEEGKLAGTGTPAVRNSLAVCHDEGELVARLLSGSECSLLLLEEQAPIMEPSISSRFGLTPREAEVVRWVACGKTNADIANILATSPRTVQKHLERVFQKLGVETRTAAAACVLEVRRCIPLPSMRGLTREDAA